MHLGTAVLQQRTSGGSDIYSFCENKDKMFAKPFGFEPRPAGPSQIFNRMFCQLSYWELGVNN